MSRRVQSGWLAILGTLAAFGFGAAVLASIDAVPLGFVPMVFSGGLAAILLASFGVVVVLDRGVS